MPDGAVVPGFQRPTGRRIINREVINRGQQTGHTQTVGSPGS